MALWTTRETELLLENLAKSEEAVKVVMGSKNKANRHFYDSAAQELKNGRYNCTAEQCRTQFKKLKTKFYETMRKSGGDPPEEQKPPFFDEMRELWQRVGSPAWQTRNKSTCVPLATHAGSPAPLAHGLNRIYKMGRCQKPDANYIHMRRSYKRAEKYWRNVHLVMADILQITLPFDPLLFLLNMMPKMDKKTEQRKKRIILYKVTSAIIICASDGEPFRGQVPKL
ncbi:uncharacterized protein LOC121916771 [Sceloporus undulatus]|uniref:uncharacterized protein LOC121916771 n=1 Tax=Sceloporus undulatus TaxID=8520 RepID=UPI001C4BBD18|nr:uncharacterized protein LOC121916771 [Sceloporus undulatus]